MCVQGWLRRFCTIDSVIHTCLRDLSPCHMRADLPAERQTRSIASPYRYAYHKLSPLAANRHGVNARFTPKPLMCRKLAWFPRIRTDKRACDLLSPSR
jgi:hypothetical protein